MSLHMTAVNLTSRHDNVQDMVAVFTMTGKWPAESMEEAVHTTAEPYRVGEAGIALYRGIGEKGVRFAWPGATKVCRYPSGVS